MNRILLGCGLGGLSATYYMMSKSLASTFEIIKTESFGCPSPQCMEGSFRSKCTEIFKIAVEGSYQWTIRNGQDTPSFAKNVEQQIKFGLQSCSSVTSAALTEFKNDVKYCSNSLSFSISALVTDVFYNYRFHWMALLASTVVVVFFKYSNDQSTILLEQIENLRNAAPENAGAGNTVLENLVLANENPSLREGTHHSNYPSNKAAYLKVLNLAAQIEIREKEIEAFKKRTNAKITSLENHVAQLQNELNIKQSSLESKNLTILELRARIPVFKTDMICPIQQNRIM